MEEKKIEKKLKEVDYNRYAKDALAQIPKGAFLTVKRDEEINTMAIGWGTIGSMWGRPVFVIGVRPSRHSFGFLEQGAPFTVSIPMNQQLKKQIGEQGTLSGKDINKYDESDLTLRDGLVVDVPVIEECELHYECRVIAKHQIIPEFVDDTIRARHYPDEDHHMIFYGEIVSCYKLKDPS